jgi:hypothetical protein
MTRSARFRRGYWAFLPVFSLVAVIACDVALNPQPLPPAAPEDGGFSSATSSDGGNSRQEPADPNITQDAAGGVPDGGIPPVSPQLDAGDAGDAALDADAN